MNTEETIQVFVRSINAQSLIFPVKKSVSVQDFKTLVSGKSGIKTEDMRLVFGSKQLENGNTLNDYGIQANATVSLVLRLPGG